MKRLVASLFIIGILFVAGCKKDGSGAKAEPYLIKSIAYGYGNVTTFDYFRYDTQNRLVEFDDYTINKMYEYGYDNISNVSSVEIFDGGTRMLQEVDRFAYSGNTVTAGRVNQDNSTTTIYTITLDDKKQPIKILYADGEYNLNTFDNNGNVTNTSFYVASGQQDESVDFTYDSKRNPILTIGTNLHLVYLLGAAVFSTNNIVVDSGLASNYTYLYYDNGLPASGSSPAQNNGLSTILYNYFTK